MPEAKLWEVPFDPAHPLTTPRTLSTDQDVVDGMAAAIKRITDRGLDLQRDLRLDALLR